MDAAFLQERIDAIKLLIVAYEAAMLAVTVGGVQSYTLDTGQTRQVVTKRSLGEIRNARDQAMNELATLSARRNGAGGIVRPCF